MKIEDHKLANEEQTPWRLFTPDNSDKEFCVLWIQGWTSSMDSHREGVERMAERASMGFATLDFAGHGLSRVELGISTRKQQHQEVAELFDELVRRGFKKVVVIGGSFGAYMAALLARVRPVHAVVLRAPANYNDDEFELEYAKTLRWEDHAAYEEKKAKATKEELSVSSAVKGIQSFNGSVYVFEHELDEVVPKIMPETYFNAAQHGNYLVVPKTKHSPKLAKDPKPHFDYIEHLVLSVLEAIKLGEKIRQQD